MSGSPNDLPRVVHDVDFNVADFEEFSDSDSADDVQFEGMQIDDLDYAGTLEYSPQLHSRESRDETEFSSRAPNPEGYSQQFRDVGFSQLPNPNEIERRPQLSAEQHAALTVLYDEELLMMYSMKSGRTLPQTRRLFQAKLIADGDRDLEEELFAARFAVPASMAHLIPELNPIVEGPGAPELALGLNGTTAYLIPARWKERVDHDESGWWAPGQRTEVDASGGRRAVKSSRKSGSGEASRVGSRSVSRSASKG
ncbi:hypothetical protein N7466_008125 [Penicillium verhagenii]|uniref:uncharacterized protein n=1 Tax=Penicillium verhagenii TaxID=1562060 RepID=UPI002544D5ED|nr:uncharacterized protein N7466_008125 [Penicillium verhagenii]KAJ5923938.1 hypothetical protein N7466_008125 [Penicillium verhagenii]